MNPGGRASAQSGRRLNRSTLAFNRQQQLRARSRLPIIEQAWRGTTKPIALASRSRRPDPGPAFEPAPIPGSALTGSRLPAHSHRGSRSALGVAAAIDWPSSRSIEVPKARQAQAHQNNDAQQGQPPKWISNLISVLKLVLEQDQT